MARGRFLSKDVSTSEKLADLPDDFHRLLWSWCVPHTDRDGRLPGSARALRAIVVPLTDRSLDEVESTIVDLCQAKLMLRYQDPNRDGLVLLMLRHEEHQVGMRYDREAPSKYGPPPDNIRTNAGPVPSVGNDTATAEVRPKSGTPPPEGKGSEVKSSQAKPSARAAAVLASDPMTAFAAAIRQRSIFHGLNASQLAEQIEGERMQTGKSVEAVVSAIGEAASNAEGCQAANDPKTARELVGMLKGFCRKARNPTPPGETAHATHVADQKHSPTSFEATMARDRAADAKLDRERRKGAVPPPASFKAAVASIGGKTGGRSGGRPGAQQRARNEQLGNEENAADQRKRLAGLQTRGKGTG